ncbi:Rne/Rng family ribonuclease [Sedimentibacter hydroxybenzoicus DSM 7310]|uniref:Ribonuclease G n=1 Tax=Sedimentibacter hydroxybenzoicus DSM 7310 TaxID=1123245 RepID=A0A974BJ70_SEDHY|nr:Rne/Rng family ribonuclease [Sedimentibacter hydroxybenzoicus]NYB74179.1 Rne/Rng family ribonuclease [Sedimentibacter hydroxybenzoicus DSM 7310]
MKQVLINSSIFFDQAAVLEDGKLIDYIHEEKNNKSVIGNIYKGRVMNILPGMNAAFIDVGLEKNAYLFLDDLLSDKFLKEKNIKKRNVDNINKVLKKGDELLLQIVREPMGEKNISVTTDISLTGKYIAFIPNSIEINLSKKIKDIDERRRLEDIGREIMSEGNGMIIRTFSKDCPKENIQQEYNMLSSVLKKIEQEYNYSYAPKLLYENNSLIEKLFYDYIDASVKEIYVENKETKEKISELLTGYSELNDIEIVESDNSFDKYNVEKQISMLFERKVDLDNGGSIIIDVTEALTVIDVNSGSFVGSESIEDTALAINLYALDEIKRQINLRNISGIIIIDFIDVKNKDNINLIVNKAKMIFKNDKNKTNVIGMTKLNLMELTRKKDKENFFNLITEECEHCNGSGRTSSKVHIFLRLEALIKRIKNNTTSEAIVLKTGSIIYYKILNECMDIINKLEQKHNMKIYFVKDKNILAGEIIVDRTGKLNYISMYVKQQK